MPQPTPRSSLPSRDDSGLRNTALLKTVSSQSLASDAGSTGGRGGGGLSRGSSAASLLRGSSCSSLRRTESGLSVLLGELQEKQKKEAAAARHAEGDDSDDGGYDAGSGGGSGSGSAGGGDSAGGDVQKEERVVMTNYGADDVPLHRRAILQKIPREWVKCIASYTALEKRLSWLMLVHALWSDEREFRLKVNIPDTVLFHNGRILCWLFTSPRTGFLLRHNSESLFMDKIAKHMLSKSPNAHPSNHAAMYWMDRGDVLIKYPSKQQLQQYTNLRDKVDLVSMVSLQKSLKFEDTYITCYTARLVHFRDDVEDYRTATYSFKIHQGRRIFLQVRELSQKLGRMLRNVISTLQHNIKCRFLYVEAVFSVDEFGKIYLTQLAQSLTRERLKQFQKDQETINPKAATGGHHGDVVRGMQTQRKGMAGGALRRAGGRKQKKSKTVSRSLGSLINRGAKALKNESDSLAMKRWIKYLNQNQGLHSESSRSLLGIKGGGGGGSRKAQQRRRFGGGVNEPMPSARSSYNGANGSSLMLGGHVDPVVGGGGGGPGGGNGNGEGGSDEEAEEKPLLMQEQQTSAVQRLHSSKLVQRFRERLMPDLDGSLGGGGGAGGAGVPSQRMMGGATAQPLVPGLTFSSSSSIGAAVRGDLSVSPNRASNIGSMGGVRAAGIAAAAAAAGDKRDFLKIVEWDSMHGGSGGAVRRGGKSGRGHGGGRGGGGGGGGGGRRSSANFGSTSSTGGGGGGSGGSSAVPSCPGLFCNSTRISDDSGQRQDELHMLPLRVVIAVLLDESFYTGVRLNEQTTMWECVVDYQNHRCLQEMLKPYSDGGGAMYARESPTSRGKGAGGAAPSSRGGGVAAAAASPSKASSASSHSFASGSNDRESYDILTALMKQIGGGAALLQAAILDAQAATPHHPFIRMGQYDTPHQAAEMYDKCVDAEIEWLRIKYQQQREKAIEQALEQGLMLRGGESTDPHHRRRGSRGHGGAGVGAAGGGFGGGFGGEFFDGTDDGSDTEYGVFTPRGRFSDSDSDGSRSSDDDGVGGRSGDSSTLSIGGGGPGGDSGPATPRTAPGFESGGSRAWEEAGIDAETRRYAAAHPRGGGDPADGSGADKRPDGQHRKGNASVLNLAPLPLHAPEATAHQAVLAAEARRRDKRREQFAQHNSRFNNQFDGTGTVDMAAAHGAKTKKQRELQHRHNNGGDDGGGKEGGGRGGDRRNHHHHRNAAAAGAGGKKKKKKQAASAAAAYDDEDPFVRQQRQQEELQKSYTKDQYMYMQSLRANSMRIRNYLPPSDPLYDARAPQASADTICVLTQKRMKLWANICSLVAPERASLRRSSLAESRLTREKHPGHWDTRLRQNLKEFQVTSANLYRTFCANLASRSYQMTKVCWKCYQGYQAILRRTELAEEEALLARQRQAGRQQPLQQQLPSSPQRQQHQHSTPLLPAGGGSAGGGGGSGGGGSSSSDGAAAGETRGGATPSTSASASASASGGGGDGEAAAAVAAAAETRDRPSTATASASTESSPTTSAALEARRKVEAVSKEFATRPEVLARTSGSRLARGGGGVAADEFQDVISFLDTVAEEKRDAPAATTRRVRSAGGRAGSRLSSAARLGDSIEQSKKGMGQKMTAERRGAQLTPYYLRSQFGGSFQDSHRALLKDLKKIKKEDHVVTPPARRRGGGSAPATGSRMRSSSSKLLPLTRGGFAQQSARAAQQAKRAGGGSSSGSGSGSGSGGGRAGQGGWH